MKKNTLTYISLFSSAGVGCYGLKMEGFECIATNEIIEKRLNIQKINNVCKLDSGYIHGDIKEASTKQLIFDELKKWKKIKEFTVDVVLATPPCQGMSVANHKKKADEISRNSLVVESVSLIKDISPKVFILENVSAFWNSCCTFKNEVIPIGSMIEEELSECYEIFHEIINFKDYGSNSSRTRALVIGVNKKYSDWFSPKDLFPSYQEEKKLKNVIGNMKCLDWGEYDSDDFFHSFRVYPERMRAWISDLKEGDGAFDNIDDFRKPHQIKNGVLVINKSKNSDKYTRQKLNKVGPCIHTRNDQLASQNTVHPSEDRVFSIRELMLMMTIPSSFKWLNHDLKYLNSLAYEEKVKISKKEEMNIRQSIGEAVPTSIIKEIGFKIKKNLMR